MRRRIYNTDLSYIFPPKNARIIVFDTETTGLTENDDIVEIAGVEIKDRKITNSKYQTYVRTKRPMGEEARKITGITEELINSGKAPDIAMKEFLDFVGDSYMVGHNVNFDFKMINSSLRKLRSPFLPKRIYKKRMYCTMNAFKKLFPDSPRWNLNVACSKMHIPTECRKLHGALEDAKLTAKLLLKLEKELERRNSICQSRTEKKRLKKRSRPWKTWFYN